MIFAVRFWHLYSPLFYAVSISKAWPCRAQKGCTWEQNSWSDHSDTQENKNQ